MKIGIVRGDFANPWELQNFEGLTSKNDVSVFTSRTNKFRTSAGMTQVRLFSPYEFFGHNKYSRAIMNRIIVDGHYLFGLEEKLKGFDIAHCAETYYSYTQQCINAKKLGYVKKVVSTVWENIPFNNEGIRGRKEFKRNAFKNIDYFLAVTQKSKEALMAEGCDEKKITVLNPGIDLEVFKKQKIKSFSGLTKNKNLKILFVGRLEPEKGIAELFITFNKLSSSNLELVIVGSGSLEQFVLGKAKSDQRIKFLGKVEYKDMPKIYSLCDIYYHPVKGSSTWSEQYGMVLVEAMACGLAVVSVDSGSIKEVVGNLETSLDKVIVDNVYRNQMTKYSLKRAKKKFDSRNYFKNLEKIYQKI